jgi:hypothetical protein
LPSLTSRAAIARKEVIDVSFNPVEPSAELDWGRQAVIGKVTVDCASTPAAKLFSKLLEVEILH